MLRGGLLGQTNTIKQIGTLPTERESTMCHKNLLVILLVILFTVGLISIGYAQAPQPEVNEQGRLTDSGNVPNEGQISALEIGAQAASEPSFTYQGRLADSGNFANGDYDFEFSLYDDLAAGSQLGSTIAKTITITDGLFTTELNFGNSIFTGDERFLEIKVKQNGGGSFSTLAPRQKLTAVPYALYAIRQNGLTPADGSPVNAVFVNNNGDVGIGTTSPVTELHIRDGDTPTVRLNQDGSLGWSPQTWDVAGNETNFFIRDSTHSSRLPFRIRPSAPTSSIDIAANGDVGIGTASPKSKLQINEGYLQLATSSGTPPATDCDEATEIGRMIVDEANTNLYVCTSSGWVTK